MAKPKNGRRRVSRRKFLQTAGIGGGAVAVGLWVKSPTAFAAPPTAAAPVGPGKVAITLEVNGKKRVLKLEPRVTLVEALREHLGLTGTKRICDHGECGACTVLVDGRATCSCMTLAADVQGKKITTIEGLLQGRNLHALQKAFIDHDAFQCGFCTPGMLMALKALVDKHPRPTLAQVKTAIAGNYCRCGAMPNILKAAQSVANA